MSRSKPTAPRDAASTSPSPDRSPLPIDPLLPELAAALDRGERIVLEAPPGAGKTTRVPPSILGADWLGDNRIVMLEPRRVAARAAARRIAHELGEPVGHTVGYRVRNDSAVSAATRIEVVTEGILTRMLHDDPALTGVGAVIFDEFHERSLNADLGLALVAGGTMLLRDDLRLIVMSATLDGDGVAKLLGGATRLTSEGRSWPVTTTFAPPRPGTPIEEHVTLQVRNALTDDEVSVLVFLPGAGEINRVADRLTGSLPGNVDLHLLHGMLTGELQDAAIASPLPGRRKVVLATNIAETSLTIDGVTVVIDSGLARVPTFSPRTGMTRLETVRISRSSADQRRGRAGRTAPGRCIRCWSATDDAALLPGTRAEILDADLASLVLELAASGWYDSAELPWLDPPPAAAWQAGVRLLTALGALDDRGRITLLGERMARFGAHPRIARMMLDAAEDGEASLRRAAVLAALLEERDILRGEGGPPPTDLDLRVDIITRDQGVGAVSIDRGTLARVRDGERNWRQRQIRATGSAMEPMDVGELLASGWPDRVAMRRDEAGRFVMRNGRGVMVDRRDALAHAEWIVAVSVDDAGRDGRLLLGSALDSASADAIVARDGVTASLVEWDDAEGAVVARREHRLGGIAVNSKRVNEVDDDALTAALIHGIRGRGTGALPFSDGTTRLRERVAFLNHHLDGWPDLSLNQLGESLEQWLAPWLSGIRRLDRIPPPLLDQAIRGMIPVGLLRDLDRLAPDRIEVPTGSRIAVDYSDPDAPVLAVRLQDIFGMATTPMLAGGKVPVVIHLLSPGYKPVQVTRDLASFWQSAYFDVRKDLRGRYPKHSWPEDPLAAAAIRGPVRRAR